MTICLENLHHAQDIQKRANDKSVNLRSYSLGDKVWLNSQYIKTKRNRKLKSKFFQSFSSFTPNRKVYKLKLPKKWKIYNVFYLSLLEQDTTKKRWVDKSTATQLEFGIGDNKEYEVEGIHYSIVFARESKAGHLLGFYYLIF